MKQYQQLNTYLETVEEEELETIKNFIKTKDD